MKRKLEKSLIITLLSIITIPIASRNVTGTILDKTSKEPLIGATVRIKETNTGAITDIDGNFILTGLTEGNTYQIEINYISYKPLQSSIKAGNNLGNIIYELESDIHILEDVVVLARKNLEGDKVLLLERQKATFAIENMGAKEMSMKGISNVSDGVKKITGISIANAGQLIVRGLGDRYSTTTLNGLPIASPNPDHKLIPLDLFPTPTIKNITVSKVYEASSFADYSGAHVDISTKENTGDDFFSVSLNIGGNFNTLFKDFYHSERKGTMLKNNNLDKKYLDMSKNDFESYIKNNDIFKTSFSISKRTSLPELGISIGMGKTWKIAEQELSLLTSAGVSNTNQILKDAFVTTLTAQGTNLNHFDYDSYTSELKIAGLAGLSYTLRESDRINYTFFYARNAIDNYMYREGYDAEKINLIGSNSVFHAYSLLNNQVAGQHEFNKKWSLDWSTSYGITASHEPDRRQVMFRKDDDKITLFKLNKQETMRYFGELDEKEFVGDLKLKHNFGNSNKVRIGGTYKDKTRDFNSVRFYYNLNQINPEINDIYNTNDFLNRENISNEKVSIIRSKESYYKYYAGNRIWAGFAEVEYFPLPRLLLHLGVRYEHSQQWVRYWSDSSIEKRSELNKNDFFPALNIKYSITGTQNIRLAVSRTVTRPSFIEMAPFLYKASYGSAEIRGNENIRNGYNFNIDLRYELFSKENNDMFSITGYYKKLDSPIERVQESSGGSAVHSFRNADNGMATGVEVEVRKKIIKDFSINVNGSYIYTNVNLQAGEGIYTDTERQLQGASPYLLNADINYAPHFNEDRRLSLAAVYNLQGPRISTVGIYGVGNIEQQALHTLDFVGIFDINKRFSTKLQVKNLLNSTVRFEQEVPKTGQTITVEEFKFGLNTEIGFTYKF